MTIYPLSSFPLPSQNRVSQIALHPNQVYLAVQSHDRSVEIFRDEVRKKQVRRQKRDEEKGKGEGKSKEGKENGDGGAMDEGIEDAEKEIALEGLLAAYLVMRASGRIRSFSFFNEETGPRGGIQVTYDSPFTVSRTRLWRTTRSYSPLWCRIPWKYLGCLHHNPRKRRRRHPRPLDSSP